MLAIIIPYYKLIFFRKTLQSLANQTDKRFKVYIGNDASPEDCRDLLAEFEGRFDFEYSRFETNIGSVSLTRQWERCIALAANEQWMMILGDDDVLGDNCVASFYGNLALAEQNNSKVIRFASSVINSDDAVFLGPYFHPEAESASDFYCRKASGQTRSSLSEYIFKKAAFEKYGFADYPLAWHSDDKAWIDFSEADPVFTINEALVFIRFSEVNISGRNDNIEEKLDANFQFFTDILNIKTSFTKSQILFLLLSFEKIIKKHRKLRNREWKLLWRHYIFCFRPIPFLKFVRRFLISILN